MVSKLHTKETFIEPRPPILDLAHRLEASKNFWGAGRALEKWVLEQPWRVLSED